MGDVHARQDRSLAPAESWRLAEEETGRMVRRIQPTVVSERRRREVVDYVQRLVRRSLGHEVFPYGSVPLKTYLPDGDIDLTAFGPPNVEDMLVGDVHAVLEGEENNKDAEFEVKDVQYINAEVKLVKCLVQNIVVDISFNQIGGLCTLYFLEKVNMKIGKDNLFKRSIILIKAWCYYESRILGAHHALISTYALETLVLYIFHLFHSSLEGPLAVLYKFLDYFSKFDWDNYCVSLHGPVPLSSLPLIIAEVPQNDGGELFLTKEFLNECANLLPFFQRVSEPNNRMFVRKHLNIVDPLKENNNLGRSVSKGNFHRIRSAFAYGARKLGRILQLPRESMKNDLGKFFTNTLERHGNGDRPDVRGTCSVFSERSPFDLSDVNNALTDSDMDKAIGDNRVMATSLSSEGSCGGLSEKLTDGKTSVSGNTLGLQTNCGTSDRSNGFYAHISENGKYLSPLKASASRITETSYNHSHVSYEVSKSRFPCTSPVFHEENEQIAEEDYFHRSQLKEMEGDLYTNGVVSQRLDENEPSNGRTSHSSTSGQLTTPSTSTSGRVIPGYSRSSNDSDGGEDNICEVGHNSVDLASMNGTADVHELADLSGDLGAHSENLLSYAQSSLGIFPAGPSSPFQGNSLDIVQQRSLFPHINGVVPPIPPFLHNFPKANRGTGPYLPNMVVLHQNQRPFRSRSFVERGRNPFPNQLPRCRSNGHAVSLPLYKCEEAEKRSHGADTSHHPASVADDRCRPGTSESFETPPSTSGMRGSGAVAPSQFQIAFGSFGPVSLGDVSAQPAKSSDSNAPHNNNSAPMYSSVVQKPPSPIQESGKLMQSYKLKDEGDFPPLAGRGSPSSPVPLNRVKTVWEIKRASALS